MKVTSFELSQKLEKIGFKAKSIFDWVAYDKKEKPFLTDSIRAINTTPVCVKAYDLETILETLPNNINYHGFEMDKYWLGYIERTEYNNRTLYEMTRVENEPLVNTAARLLILLKEEGEIDFN